jgi:hypothetical protein
VDAVAKAGVSLRISNMRIAKKISNAVLDYEPQPQFALVQGFPTFRTQGPARKQAEFNIYITEPDRNHATEYKRITI